MDVQLWIIQADSFARMVKKMKIAAKFCSAIYNLHLQWNRFEPVVGEECGIKVEYWTKNAKTFPSLTSKLRILPCAQDIAPP